MSTRWPRRNRNTLALLLVAGASILALMYARRASQPSTPHPAVADTNPAAAYINPSVCASCHEQIARTYSLTGMARAFSKVSGTTFKTPSRVYHKASDRYYTMVERDGKFYQRRHQIGFDGSETNVLELEAHYVIGSGNHAQTFLHRNPDGRLVQMPVSWYAERGGYWAMSPGYDRSAHLDFRRPIDAGCMTCHNGYPTAPIEDDGGGLRLRADGATAGQAADSLPEGIDCQRCHGPGRAHVDAIKGGNVDAARRAIVNPAALSRERQLDVCMQCHLESTSSPLPFQIQRYEHPTFSYTPGQALSDFFIHFDHAPGTPSRDDKFEIAGGAYRLRKSACFQRSEMTCVTCHDPHDIARGPKGVERYVAVCQSCHDTPHRGGVPQVPGMRASATCLDCHMPKRRTEDAVHVVMTDHFIQRQQARRNLLADLTEADTRKLGDYRGEVVLYYPATLPPTPENELYLALAQVRQSANLTDGIPRLQRAIEKYQPQRPEFYYELARAYSLVADYDADIRWCREALRRDATFVPALKELAAAATTKGNLTEAAQALERVVARRPNDGNAFADLGNVYLRQGRLDEAQKTLQRALALDATMPQANNMMGLAALKNGSAEIAETHLREAIRLQPDLEEAHYNLGNLLAARRAYAEAGYHFEHAIRSNPDYVDAHHSYGVVLALTHSTEKAAAELQTAVRLAPGLAQAHLDLADVLATLGRTNDAAREYTIAANGNDAAAREAAQAGLRGLGR
jgi:tetratricopeptide (TPR) repeat protein